MKPDEGLNPRTTGSRPEPKADAQPLSHPGVPGTKISDQLIIVHLGLLVPPVEYGNPMNVD